MQILFISPFLSFLPHHIAIAVNEHTMAPPIRSRNTRHLLIKVDNVATFTVTDFHNKVIHKVKKAPTFSEWKRCTPLENRTIITNKIITW